MQRKVTEAAEALWVASQRKEETTVVLAGYAAAHRGCAPLSVVALSFSAALQRASHTLDRHRRRIVFLMRFK